MQATKGHYTLDNFVQMIREEGGQMERFLDFLLSEVETSELCTNTWFGYPVLRGSINYQVGNDQSLKFQLVKVPEASKEGYNLIEDSLTISLVHDSKTRPSPSAEFYPSGRVILNKSTLKSTQDIRDYKLFLDFVEDVSQKTDL